QGHAQPGLLLASERSLDRCRHADAGPATEHRHDRLPVAIPTSCRTSACPFRQRDGDGARAPLFLIDPRAASDDHLSALSAYRAAWRAARTSRSKPTVSDRPVSITGLFTRVGLDIISWRAFASSRPALSASSSLRQVALCLFRSFSQPS